ncbi:hypothetical protein D3C76_1058710 [compost metagenome]
MRGLPSTAPGWALSSARYLLLHSSTLPLLSRTTMGWGRLSPSASMKRTWASSCWRDACSERASRLSMRLRYSSSRARPNRTANSR